MEKPNTPQEKKACEEAINEVIQEDLERKAMLYKDAMNNFINYETEARKFRKLADETKELLGLSDKKVESLFGKELIPDNEDSE